MKTDTTAVAAKAAQVWFSNPDRSPLRFFNVTDAAALGTGVTNRSDLKRIKHEVRRKMKDFDAIPVESR